MNKINELRNEVDRIDTMTLELLAKRIEIVKKIAEQKQNAKLQVLDIKREDQLRKLWGKKAIKLGLEVKLVSDICEVFLGMSKKIQEEVMK